MPRISTLFTLFLSLGGLCYLSSDASAQVLGGRYAFGWLALPPTAATTALGGWQLRADDRDPGLALWNPALLNANSNGVIQVGQDFMPSGVGRSIIAGGKRIERWGVDGGAHLQYVGFGDFTGRDESGANTNDFKAQGFTFGVSASKAVFDRLKVGATLSFTQHSIESYQAFGASLSAGAVYTPDTTGQTLFGLQVQHAGYVFNRFTEQRDPMPVDVSLTFSRRLEHLPLRFGLIYRKLDRWNLLYDDPDRRDNTSILGGNNSSERSSVARNLDNFGRHLGVNAELALGKRELILIRLGFDRQRQQEGKVQAFRSLAGFSYGLGINTRKWRLDYGHTVQHLAGGSNYLTFMVDFGASSRNRGA